MEAVRRASAAGRFYPDDPEELRVTVGRLLAEASAGGPPGTAPKAVIAPHAGYAYSGPTAARAFARATAGRGTIRRVVMLGPAHYAPTAIAASSAEWFETPLGRVRVDRRAVEEALRLPDVTVDDTAHAPEHSLEVVLPFVQMALGEVEIAPFVIGTASPREVQGVLRRLWGGPETLICVSTDLSHFLPYAEACRRDAATYEAILGLRPERIGPQDACGRAGLQALLREARERGMRTEPLELCNSGDTAGTREQVVGYAAMAMHEGPGTRHEA